MRQRTMTTAVALVFGAAAACGCGGGVPSGAGVAMPGTVPGAFVDVTDESGIHFVHVTGATGAKLLPETMGSGCAWFDADGDDRPDLYLVNGTRWPGTGGPPGIPALYRNLGGGRFADVTRAAGLAVETYGMGVAVGDYDNDGAPDLFVSAVGPDRLFRNLGGGRFEEVGRRAGVDDDGFGAGATFVDYDRDGLLDLFVAHYVRWSVEDDLFCTLDGSTKSYCTPQPYSGTVNRLYRNRGDGTFDDVTAEAGLAGLEGKSLGVVAFDHDRDGWPDLAVSNDTVPNFLLRNDGDGTFSEIGRRAGIAYSDSGEARAGMGIDAGDIDGSGRDALVVGNFSAEMVGLFRNTGLETYSDDAGPAGIGTPTLWTLAFGTFFFDYDLDGWLDLLVVNGHVEPGVNAVQKQVTYAQSAQLFHNSGAGAGFVEVDAGDLARPLVGRGAAYADYDGDGDLDVAVTTSGGPTRLFRNDTPGGRWLRVHAVGRVSARDAYGAQLTLRAGETTLRRTVRAATSYLSQSEEVVTFGLGADGQADALEILWPSGLRQSLADLPSDTEIVVVEGQEGWRSAQSLDVAAEPR